MKNKGILYMIISAFFFSVMAASVKSVPNLPLTEKMFFRNFIGLLAVSITLIRTKTSIKVHQPLWMLLRAILGLSGVGLYYAALERLPLADAVILNKLSPFFVMIFAVAFLKERIKTGQKLAILVSLLGAVIIIKPTFDITIIPGLLALLSAVFAGAAYTIIRKLSATDKPIVIIFYFCLVSSILLIPFMMIEGVVMPSLTESLGLLSIGISAFLAQFFMTTAYKLAPASELSVYTYINILFSSLWGIVLWSEIPDFLSFLGGALIIVAGIINYYVTAKAKAVSSLSE
ncbi:DMT family transporter [Alkaliphilus serpentinus]|uniref:DMT family transporter n=1 Tax=Alkaliphilus serpentinus TaxID=1482731 RepID=A0A833HLN6_9FIRM|nr:DMT family transporter [Alkaliphilus serpentinus]KAB3526243.1 DMT family transporter [Alkaliphilus serpentinus]